MGGREGIGRGERGFNWPCWCIKFFFLKENINDRKKPPKLFFRGGGLC